MKKMPLIIIALCMLATTLSCSTDRDDELRPLGNLEIQNFIYSAMNIWYLYKPQVPALADNNFETQTELNDFLSSFDSPESLFYDGLMADVDRFSFITADYRELENRFAGVSKSNGMEFGFYLNQNDNSLAYAVVRYVLPNTSAAQNGVKRGMIFNRIDGVPITVASNGSSISSQTAALIAQDSYTIGLAELGANNTINDIATEITLVKAEYTENPVFIAKTLTIDNQKIGYLMYNSYTSNFDSQLNAAFAQFKADQIQHLVLDLRYNGGGSVETAKDLSSMITGQFKGEVFYTAQYNPQIQEAFTSQGVELSDFFDSTVNSNEPINSLGLTQLYVIGTGSTASASELTINGLRAYIDVKLIGTTTVGKFQASRTFYDSEAPNFSRDGVNINHFYAIQPLIFTSVNANGEVGPPTGLVPDFVLREDPSDFGILGDANEPLLNLALDQILGKSHSTKRKAGIEAEAIGESGMQSPTFQRMYVDDLPESL